MVLKVGVLVSVLAMALAAACGGTGGNGMTPDGGGGGGGGGDGGGSGSASGFRCSNATLFAGDPTYSDPTADPTDGTGILKDPPFKYRNLVFTNGQVLTHDGQTLWRVDLSTATLHVVAGSESAGQALITGACAQARFANVSGIAVTSDGSLLVSDNTANTVLEVSNPLSATTCSVSHVAGTNTDIPDDGTITPGTPPNVGDTDGPGAQASFDLPGEIAVDSSDNAYVVDTGNQSIRKIASDGSHTVSTLATFPNQYAATSLAVLNGKLYVLGIDGVKVFLESVDTASGATADLFRGDASVFGGDSSDSIDIGQLTTDGTALFFFANGQVFRVTTGGMVSAALAGVYQPGLDFAAGYDPTAAHSADSVQLVSLDSRAAEAGLATFLTLDSSHNIYVSADDVCPYVEKVSCTP